MPDIEPAIKRLEKYLKSMSKRTDGATRNDAVCCDIETLIAYVRSEQERLENFRKAWMATDKLPENKLGTNNGNPTVVWIQTKE